LPLSTVTQATGAALREAGGYLADLVTPTVRLGVTGLARSGKTVFIAALVRNLTLGGRLPFFSVASEGRLIRAYLEPQPDDAIPRFAYEDHLAALARDPPVWPESTRRISQLRVTIEYASASRVRRTLTPGRLHLDIVDYPGEWLVDLPMMAQSYADWSAEALALAGAPRRAAPATAWLAFVRGLDAAAGQDEQVAITGAKLFTDYLIAARAADPTLSITGPGRFLLPGDLEGSPLLTFFPLPGSSANNRSALAQMMERRFESYKNHVVRPFFRDHFSRLDRQIVLVDALSALNSGAAGIADLEGALTGVLAAFRPGRASWLGQLFAPRIDRIAFAATKADHLHSANHDRLEAILGTLTARAEVRASGAGAEVRALALAALRATREGEVTRDGQRLACIVGTPLAGETIGGKVFDGKTSAAVFPGDLPRLDQMPGGSNPDTLKSDIHVVRFSPPRIATETPSGLVAPWPHVRLDRALEFLIGDHLA
jgi:predicted YcjX-like family ATPase